MTTVAADLKEGIMVSDSQVTVEHKGFAYPAVKIVKKGGLLIGAAGHGGDCTRFMKWAAGKFQDKEPKWEEQAGLEDSVVGIVLKDDGIYIWSQGDPEPERIEAEQFAVGSGGKAARAAMVMGADVVKAVEIACQVDAMYSSLPVQILRLKNGKD